MPKNYSKNLSPRERLLQKYNMARTDLLIIIVLTLVNILLLVTNTDSYFLFSASIPYYVAFFGMVFSGRLPAEYYEAMEMEIPPSNTSILIPFLVIAFLLTLGYLVLWLLSGKRRAGWLIAALVFFGVDTLFLIVMNGISLNSALEIFCHAWLIYTLIAGILAHKKLKTLPEEEEEEEEAALTEDEAGDKTDGENSESLRPADTEVKHRVLLAAEVPSLTICYRRVKHTNELVINGHVYDEIEGIIEKPHVLEAVVGGHTVQAIYNGTLSIIEVDGETVAKKLRLY